MTKGERVTQFSLEGSDGKPITQRELMRSVSDHIARLKLIRPQDGEHIDFDGFCCVADWSGERSQALPERFRWLIAFWVEGESEGWYVHVGSLYQGTYTDFGHAKTFDPESAKAIAVETQRFLTAAMWN